MKYLGKKSLSSFFSALLNVSWYIVIIVSVLGIVVGSYIIFASPVDAPGETALSQVNYEIFKELQKEEDWQDVRNFPVFVRGLFIPYFMVVVFFLLKILKKGRKLFKNFKNDVVFNKENVSLLGELSRLLIIFSIMTFNFSSLLLAVILLILSDIFKDGTILQEEYDLTV